MRSWPLVLAVLLLAVPPPPAAALTPPSQGDVRQAERDRAAQLQAQRDAASRAAAAAARGQALVEARAAAAARLRDAEAATAAAAARVADLARRQRDAEARLDARVRALGPMLPVIERMSLFPAETLLAVPLPPDEAVRGLLTLRGLAREVSAQAAAARTEQDDIATLAEQSRRELPRLAEAQATQAARERALDQQIESAQAARDAAEDDAAAAARQAAAYAARAETLRAAIARIEAADRDAEARARRTAEAVGRQKPDADTAAATSSAPASAAELQAAITAPMAPGGGARRAALTAPVAGTVVRAFGAANEAGPSNGMAYQAAPAARVVAPCAGHVVFAGPFRSYGQLMIVDCGGGTHVVMAGLDRLDATVGRAVRAGDPIGVMPTWDPRGAGGRPSLYVELRRNGQAVNPAPFLRAKG